MSEEKKFTCVDEAEYKDSDTTMGRKDDEKEQKRIDKEKKKDKQKKKITKFLEKYGLTSSKYALALNDVDSLDDLLCMKKENKEFYESILEYLEEKKAHKLKDAIKTENKYLM